MLKEAFSGSVGGKVAEKHVIALSERERENIQKTSRLNSLAVAKLEGAECSLSTLLVVGKKY